MDEFSDMIVKMKAQTPCIANCSHSVISLQKLCTWHEWLFSATTVLVQVEHVERNQ